MALDVPKLHWYQGVHYNGEACIVREIRTLPNYKPMLILMPTSSRLLSDTGEPEVTYKLIGKDAISKVIIPVKWHEEMERLGIMIDKGIDEWVAIIKDPEMRPDGNGGLEQVMDMFWTYIGTGGTIEDAVRDVIAKHDTGQGELKNANPFTGGGS